jgi:hypothetical protein
VTSLTISQAMDMEETESGCDDKSSFSENAANAQSMNSGQTEGMLVY